MSSSFARAGLVLAILVAGCSSAGPSVDIIKDDSVPRSEWTTPSAEGIRASARGPAVRQRKWPGTEARTEPCGVPHFPTWTEDPFEDKGDGNDEFTWTLADLTATFYCPARWTVNLFGMPASVVATPPGTTMISDGYLSRQLLGYDHDATPGKSWAVSTPTAHTPTTQPAQQ